MAARQLCSLLFRAGKNKPAWPAALGLLHACTACRCLDVAEHSISADCTMQQRCALAALRVGLAAAICQY